MADIAKISGIAIASAAKAMGIAGAKVMGLAWPSGGGFLPSDIADLLRWYAADAIVGLIDGDPVDQWDDLTATGGYYPYLTHDNDAYRPLYKTNIVNGKPALLFDGSDDYLTQNTGANKTAGCQTVVAVAYYPAATFAVYAGLIGGLNNDWIFGSNGSANWYSVGGVTCYKDGVNTLLAVTTAWHVFIGIKDTPVDDYVRVGKQKNTAGRVWAGYIAEALVYGHALTSIEIADLTAYLMTKYGIT